MTYDDKEDIFKIALTAELTKIPFRCLTRERVILAIEDLIKLLT